MGLFDRKPKMSVQEWCEHFYDRYVFAPAIGGQDPWQLFCKTARDQVARVDPAFAAVDATALSEHLLALRLEVVGIAWILRVKDSLAPQQSECTRHYLLSHKQERFWELMEPFNQAAARAVVGGSDPNTATGRAHIAFINSMRAQLFDKWVTMVSDPKDAARPANRIGSDVPWKSNRSHVYLSFELTRQLQCELSDEARHGLMAIIHGFFNGTTEELQKVKIVS